MGQLDGNQEFNLYRDISQRTGGEIYIGVVGPVRTGKSTFIKRFMDLMVLQQIENEHERTRTQDELPQSSGGGANKNKKTKIIHYQNYSAEYASEKSVIVTVPRSVNNPEISPEAVASIRYRIISDSADKTTAFITNEPIDARSLSSAGC